MKHANSKIRTNSALPIPASIETSYDKAGQMGLMAMCVPTIRGFGILKVWKNDEPIRVAME